MGTKEREKINETDPEKNLKVRYKVTYALSLGVYVSWLTYKLLNTNH